MILRLLQLVAAIAAFTFPAHAQDAAPPAAEAEVQDYVRFTGDDKRGKLETVVLTMKNDAGVVVDLIGAVHIGDKSYYAELTELFKAYEVLLFELVDGQTLKESMELQPKKKAARVEVPDGDGENAPTAPDKDKATSGKDNIAFTILRGMMTGLGSYLRLEYQTDGIDYHTANFVHADVSMAEFQRLQDERGESFLTLFQKAFQAQLSGVGPQGEDPKPSQLLLAILGDSSGIKIAMAQMLASVEEHGDVLGFGADSVIVGERDRVALEVFDKEVAAGRKKLGIFYGAAHLPDLQERLEKRGYKLAGEKWITAWDVKPRVDEQKQK